MEKDERPTSNVEWEKLKKQIKKPELLFDILNENKRINFLFFTIHGGL